MTEKTHDKELDVLKADIASLREDISSLAAGMKKFAETKAAGTHDAAGKEGPDFGEQGRGVFADLLHKFNSSRIQGEKVVRDLSAEVELHPLVSVMAAFGLGYIIAKLWYRENEQQE